MRTELFKDIADRLKDQVPELSWIDMEWGQLEIPEESYPVQFDCALISFPDIPWEQLGLNVQEGLVQILIRIGVDMYSDTHTADGITAPDRDLALVKLTLPDKVYKALNGFEGDYFEKIVRLRSAEERREDGLKVFNEYFVTKMRDSSAVKVYTDTNATLKVDGEFTEEV
jgi:hypothetical protein